MRIGEGVCPLCNGSLINDSKVTHIDHKMTVEAFADQDIKDDLTFDGAYRQLWEDSHLHAVHHKCNLGRNVEVKT